MTEQTPTISATQRPSEDVIDRALRHIRNGILAYVVRVPSGIKLPSGNGGPAHEITRDGDQLRCTCLAGQKGQMCWAVTTYQLASGLAAQWDAAEPPHYRPIEDDNRPADTDPTDKDQVMKPEPPATPAAKPATAKPAGTKRGTRKKASPISATIAELDGTDLQLPAEGRKVAWFGTTGFGVHLRTLRATEADAGDEARPILQSLLASTYHQGTCAVCDSELVSSNNGKSRVCWDHGLFVPNPQHEEEAA